MRKKPTGAARMNPPAWMGEAAAQPASKKKKKAPPFGAEAMPPKRAPKKRGA